MRNDEIQFVQFMHPGPESEPGPDGWKPWRPRLEPHRRTFVSNPGSFRRGLDGSRAESSQLHFWCEWECEAELIQRFLRPPTGYPHYLFRPWFRSKGPDDFRGLSNTDPFVFDGPFRYCICRQPKLKVLRYLAPGSVIAFGSNLREEFVIDTVFVVSNGIWYRKTDRCKSLGVTEFYYDAAIAPVCCDADLANEQYRLYEGATPDGLVRGMFSYFPCVPADKSENGFPRPVIRPTGPLMGLITPNHKMGIKATAISSTRAKEIWNAITTQVLEHDVFLGVSSDIPKRLPPK